VSAKPNARARAVSEPRKRAGAVALVKSAPGATAGKSGTDSSFDRLVYERVRLGIMSALAVQEELTFSELKGLFSVSDGNLSAHARKLEEAQYVTCTKSFDGRRPRTVYRLTAAGRAALNRYLDHVEAVIKATRPR
jgi:DNA-binding MarR family transcriptional regulator